MSNHADAPHGELPRFPAGQPKCIKTSRVHHIEALVRPYSALQHRLWCSYVDAPNASLQTDSEHFQEIILGLVNIYLTMI